jgi:hypothetical protein
LSVVFFVVIGFARNPRGRCLARRGRHPFGQQDRLCTAYVLLALPEDFADPLEDPLAAPEEDPPFDPPAGVAAAFVDVAAALSDEPDLPPSDDAPALLPSPLPLSPDAFEPLLASLLDPLDPLPPRKSVTYQPEPFS